jgi:hypothetical protein
MIFPEDLKEKASFTDAFLIKALSQVRFSKK